MKQLLEKLKSGIILLTQIGKEEVNKMIKTIVDKINNYRLKRYNKYIIKYFNSDNFPYAKLEKETQEVFRTGICVNKHTLDNL